MHIDQLEVLLPLIPGVPEKNDPTCSCQNFVKSPPNLIIFGRQIAKTMELCKAYLLSTLCNLF